MYECLHFMLPAVYSNDKAALDQEPRSDIVFASTTYIHSYLYCKSTPSSMRGGVLDGHSIVGGWGTVWSTNKTNPFGPMSFLPLTSHPLALSKHHQSTAEGLQHLPACRRALIPL